MEELSIASLLWQIVSGLLMVPGLLFYTFADLFNDKVYKSFGLLLIILAALSMFISLL